MSEFKKYNPIEVSNQPGEQELQLRRDELVRKIWKTFGEKSILVFLPLFLGIASAAYISANKSEIDKNHTLACKYQEDPVIRLEQLRKYNSPDCFDAPSSKFIGESILAGLYTSTVASVISFSILLSSKKIAKQLIKEDKEN
jgi:hypothetical protein